MSKKTTYTKSNKKGKKPKISAALKHQVLEVASYYAERKSTCRATAKEFNISKSTVHYFLTRYLPKCGNKSLEKKVNAVLKKNKAERAIRGGIATKEKYEALRGGKAE